LQDGALIIVTSFCEEGDLFNLIRRKASKKEFFTEAHIMDMFLQTASAVRYIHSKKVLHRDLKTQNIFIAKGGIIKLGDFGISKVWSLSTSRAETGRE
jgi:NIMA (never in mitosis gene a)-related kinase